MSRTQLVSPFKCRMWHMHDRVGDDISVESCASLVRSIQRHGQKQPALGRPARHGGEENEFELIYGARRLFAAQHLGVELLVELRDIDDQQALVEMDIENRVREDISPYERGLSYKRWLRNGHFGSQSELARCLGVSEAQVSRLLRYAELPAVIVNAFASPREIREEWAVVLAKHYGDATLRERMVARARALIRSEDRVSAQHVYESLVSGRAANAIRSRPRDEVVRSSTGRPVMRIGFRAKTVHLIVPREDLTPSALRLITDSITDVLDGAGGHKEVRERGKDGPNLHLVSAGCNNGIARRTDRLASRTPSRP